MEPENTGPAGSSAGLDFLFERGGLLSREIKNFEPRAQQVEMAGAVHRALKEQTHLIVEAGTGVGKSLAYLLPLAAWTCSEGRRAVVATYTKTLQQQLIRKDLPIARKVLEGMGLELNYALLMGSENYLCVRRLFSFMKRGRGLYDSPGHEQSLSVLAGLCRQSDTGLRSSLPVTLPDSIWSEIRRESDLCLRRHCQYYELCLHRKEVARARESQIVVANQHLFFAGMPIPSFDAVVLDEAHNVEGVAADYLGIDLSNYRVRRLLGEIYNTQNGRGVATRLKNRSERWLGEMASTLDAAQMRSEAFFMQALEKLGLQAALFAGEQKEVRVLSPNIIDDTLTPPLTMIIGLLGEALASAADAEEETLIKAYKNRCTVLCAEIKEFLKCEGRDRTFWVSARLNRGRPVIELRMTPLDIAPVLAEELFEPTPSVILTSATLAVAGKFNMTRRNLGMPSSPEKLLDSPFNYMEQAALYIPNTMPDPNAESALFEARSIKECADIIGVVRGGVFVLCTSWGFLKKAAALLTEDNLGRSVFVQGSGAPEDIIREFKRVKNGVLLATDTFWQGVDVPGQALACVIITRLPFRAPDSPVEEAREEWLSSQGREVFSEYSLPKAVIKFHQGFGRLIRNSDDYGAVAVLDPRVTTRRYGAQFLRSIPKCPVLRDLKELKEFYSRREKSAA